MSRSRLPRLNYLVLWDEYILPCVSGVLLFLSFPLTNYSFLAWFALVPLLISLMNGYNPFKKGFITGLVFFFGTQGWINNSVTHYGHLPFLLGVSLVLLLCAYEGLYIGLFGYLVYQSRTKTKIPIYLAIPSLWVGMEYLKGTLLTGFPWSFLGYTQYRAIPLIQISSITGVYGVSFILVMSNAVIAGLILENPFVRLKNGNYAKKAQAMAVLAVVIIITLAYGYARINSLKRGEAVTVSVIQGNIAQGIKWDKRYQEEVIRTYEELSREALKDNPQLIVWPETALPFFFYSDTKNTEPFVEFEKSLHTYLLFGTALIREHSGDSYKLTNSAVLLNPDGQISYVYDKIHLVPFGEYVPLKNVLTFVNKMVNAIGDFASGKVVKPAEVPFGSFGVHICYEIAFPNLVREFYKNGGDFIISITNDAWFGVSAGPYQHFIMSVFRAVENGKPMVRAANTGISGFIDATGVVSKNTELFKKAVLTYKIYKYGGRTFYSVYGDVFAYICNLFNLLMVIKIIKIKIAEKSGRQKK